MSTDSEMINMRVFATELGINIFGRDIGDHTWVSSDDGFCDGCRFGVADPGNQTYCNPDFWKDGRYHPPKFPGTRELGNGTVNKNTARCIAGEPSTYLGIPFQSGIVYAVNGVCHTLSNRICYPSEVTVNGANGYEFTRDIFGVYGTFVPMTLIPPFLPVPFFPFFVANPLLVAAAAHQIVVLVQWQEIRDRCVLATFSTEVENTEQAGYFSRVQQLHEQRLMHAAPMADPMEVTQQRIAQLQQDSYDMQMQEVSLGLEYFGKGIADGKLADVHDVWSAFHREGLEHTPTPMQAESATPSPEDMSEETAGFIADFMNRKTSEVLHNIIGILGPDDYQKLYHSSPDKPFILIDPTILAGAFSNK